MTTTPRYLVWYDDTKTTPPARRITDGASRYVDRFGRAPNVVLVNPRDAETPAAGMRVVPVARIEPNTYQFGYEPEAAPPPGWELRHGEDRPAGCPRADRHWCVDVAGTGAATPPQPSPADAIVAAWALQARLAAMLITEQERAR